MAETRRVLSENLSNFAGFTRTNKWFNGYTYKSKTVEYVMKIVPRGITQFWPTPPLMPHCVSLPYTNNITLKFCIIYNIQRGCATLQIRCRGGGVVFYPTSELSENLHTPSPNGLVFGGTIKFPRLPRFDLDLTSSDLQWRHNWYFDIFHPVYHVRIFWKFAHTLPSRSSVWRYHRIFEATSIWPRFDLQWPPMTS